MKKRKIFLFGLLVLFLISIFLIVHKFVKQEENSYSATDNRSDISQRIETDTINMSMIYEQNVIYEKKFEFTAYVQNIDPEKTYKMVFIINGENFTEKFITSNGENIIIDNIENINEGENSFEMQFFVDEVQIGTINFSLYYVDPYTKQFLDEMSTVGFSTHFGYMYNQDGDMDIQLMKNMGCFNVRDDIRFNLLDRENALDWVDNLNNNNIKLYAIIMPPPDEGFGNDNILNSKEELNVFSNIMKSIVNKIDDKVYRYEMYNEPNWTIFTTENIKWYARQTETTINIIGKNRKPSDIIIGATCASGAADGKITSINFLSEVEKNDIYKYNVGISIHSYDLLHSLDAQHQKLIQEHLEFINEQGGFQHFYVSEYGVDTSNYGETEDYQANLIIRQTVYNNMYGVKNSYIYGFRDMGFDMNNAENYYGVVTHDYKPKKAYYAVKEYFTNTNGAEYIGTVNLADGLEAHVYDKDGKPKIIAWSDNADNTITIPYKNFTASDIYGNEIENTDGTLEITTSPVYLDNISDEYFYEAISNTTLEKYEEFEEKFEAEIANINGLQEEINKLKEYMVSIASNSTEDENVAIEQMNTHFNLGNVILSAYKNGSLDVEYVKLSSMLDMLNDIGSSYEDLLTVCATTRAPYYTTTEELINSAESKINNNSDLEIVYPSKILDFAKELDEKSEYINSLSEENDIKTGLIVSNSLHAYYLADWANEFASIYIDEYIEVNPVTVSYSNTDEWTNQDVTATLNIGNDDATVTNNGGSNTYIFKANGSFTFEYERRGQAFKLEAKVSNIDKTYPTIAGVKDGQTYTSGVKPVIEDINLSIVSISYNGENIEYYEGITLEDEGMYSIVATDRAGNTTTVEFNIISDVQDKYILQGNYLLNVWQETTLADFKNNYTSQEESYIIKRNDTELTDTDIIATGDIIELSSGDTYTIVVAGDINCDGRVTVFDLSALRRYILKQIEFTEIELLSADINIDGNNIGAKDYSRMRLEILGMH